MGVISTAGWRTTTPLTPDWTRRALCARIGRPDDWHPDHEGAAVVTQLREVCARCPVSAQCLETALSSRRPLTGVWAGTTTSQRRRMRGARRAAAKAANAA
ncbi:WhiB family transcriptional regulator [Nocardiopsis sp. NPDC049922]|uniref:WhiB family transcriptional regulator n=1 Tax=Nocardiopsis sp. NPDC049922 TaxID=3155157 RepID=UPI0033DD6694